MFSPLIPLSTFFFLPHNPLQELNTKSEVRSGITVNQFSYLISETAGDIAMQFFLT